jgi:hypothetical protein
VGVGLWGGSIGHRPREVLHEPKTAATRYRVRSELSASLRELEVWGLVEFRNQKWHYRDECPSLHLDAQSHLSRVNNFNWRSFALSRPSDPATDVHNSAVFTISRSDYQRLQEDVINFIAAQRSKISRSGSEELCVFCCDFGPVAR